MRWCSFMIWLPVRRWRGGRGSMCVYRVDNGGDALEEVLGDFGVATGEGGDEGDVCVWGAAADVEACIGGLGEILWWCGTE